MTGETGDEPGDGPRDDEVPVPYRVGHRRVETHDVATLRLEPLDGPTPPFRPGQFTMLHRIGIGGIAVSISGGPTVGDPALLQTVRDVGAVSRALQRSRPGDLLGVRGPFGVGWGVEEAVGHDVVVVAGGLGLAPLRPLVRHVLTHRRSFGRVVVVAGARAPEEFVHTDQLAAWARRPGIDVRCTVDRATAGWRGAVGFVTDVLVRLDLEPGRTRAFLCGPEPMMRLAAELLVARGVDEHAVEYSLERSMHCGVGRCGHCQLGPLLLCRDGPVVDHARALPLLRVPEL